MPFDGSGNYYPPSPEFPAVGNEKILASDFNTIISDLANALSLVLPKDGQSPMTGILNLGGYKGINAGAGTNADDLVILSQLTDIATNAIKALKALTPAANSFPYFTSATEAALLTIMADIRTALSGTDLADFRDKAGFGDSAVLDVGTASGTVAAGDHTHAAVPTWLHALLKSLAAVISAADKLPYLSAENTFSLCAFTGAARTLLACADAAAMLSALGAQAADAATVKANAVTAYTKQHHATEVDLGSVSGTITLDANDHQWVKATITDTSTFAAPANGGVPGKTILVHLVATAARTLAWNAKFLATDEAGSLPTTLPANKDMVLQFLCINSSNEWLFTGKSTRS